MFNFIFKILVCADYCPLFDPVAMEKFIKESLVHGKGKFPFIVADGLSLFSSTRQCAMQPLQSGSSISTIESAVIPSFVSDEATLACGELEALQVLNYITLKKTCNHLYSNSGVLASFCHLAIFFNFPSVCDQ